MLAKHAEVLQYGAKVFQVFKFKAEDVLMYSHFKLTIKIMLDHQEDLCLTELEGKSSITVIIFIII